MAVASTVAALAFAGPSAASVILGMGAPKCMNGGGCFTSPGVQTHTMATAGSGTWQAGGITLNRALLGRHVNSVFQITFWTADGSRQVGDFGSFMIGGLLGDEVTLSGPAFQFDGAWGDMVVKLEVRDFGAAGRTGGSGGLRASLPDETGGEGSGSGGGGGGSGPGYSGGFGNEGAPGGGSGSAGGAEPSYGDIGGDPAAAFGTEESFSGQLAAFVPEPDAGEPGALVAAASPNPEPATWLMAILGFGLAGASLRRRAMAAKPA